MFNRLIAREDGIIDPAYAVYFRDIYDHLVRSFEVVDSYRDLMSSAMDAYLSMVANRQNELIQRLTLFTTIFMPITRFSPDYSARTSAICRRSTTTTDICGGMYWDS